MAPPKDGVPPHAIDRTPEYLDFMEKLKAYHIKRGTTLDPEPKVNLVHLDLFQVFNHIVANGGYDKVSEEKLAWRRMALELGLQSNNEASTAFSLKEKFYKNLAAYEISTVHGKEPPPKDILEDVTAKGAGLLSRTRENFRGGKRDSNFGGDGASDNDATPAKDRPAAADAAVSSSRASRGLREAPPQRVPFQPDTGPTRSTRQASGTHTSHHPNQSTNQGTPTPNPRPATQSSAQPYGAQTGPPQQQRFARSAAFTFTPPNLPYIPPGAAGYEPRPRTTLALRPVDTPANNAPAFTRRQIAPPQVLQPGTGFNGPNIYQRCLMALKSRIPAEEAYALTHLTKISYERGDKFKFESFPGLREALIDKILEVWTLFYAEKWEITWSLYPDFSKLGTLSGERGTRNLLKQIQAMTRIGHEYAVIQPPSFADKLQLVNEAGLTLRNMSHLPDNAAMLGDYWPTKDLITIVLHLPNHDSLVELKHYMLDIAEQITPFLELDAGEPVYTTLLAQLNSDDRGTILTALKALSRISLNDENTVNKLPEVPARALQNVSNWLLLNDDELMDACLDFLYQYTAVVPNVENLLKSVEPEAFVRHLVRLLSYGAKKVVKVIQLEKDRKLPAKDQIAAMPADLLTEMLRIGEPDRVHQWIRAFFEEDKDSFVTQIAAWQAYQSAFTVPLRSLGQTLITPAEFIRNATMVYKDSVAQVLREPGEMQQKFIIQGIRTRERPVGIDGKDYLACLWASKSHPEKKCGRFFSSAQNMWTHIFMDHLEHGPEQDGRFKNIDGTFTCKWDRCVRYAQPAHIKLIELSRHVKMHVSAMWQDLLPDPAGGRKKGPSWIIPGRTMTMSYEETPTARDERAPNGPPQAAGIPLSAVLVLRNIARNAVRTESEEELRKAEEAGGEPGGWNEKLFGAVSPRLFEVLVENKVLAEHVASLLELIRPDH